MSYGEMAGSISVVKHWLTTSANSKNYRCKSHSATVKEFLTVQQPVGNADKFAQRARVRWRATLKHSISTTKDAPWS